MSQADLTLLQWLSPNFPVGAFAYSHGLEQEIWDGHVGSAEDLRCWLTDLLEHGSLLSDAVLLNAAMATDEPAEIDLIARAFCASRERLLETQLQGRAFCQAVNEIWHAELGDLTYPVAVGAASRMIGVTPDKAVLFYLQALCGNLVSVCQRALPLGQNAGQNVLQSLQPAILSAASRAAASSIDTLGAASFSADIASMRHETLQPRIFRT